MADVVVDRGTELARRLTRALLAVVMVPVVVLAVPPTPAGAVDTYVVTTTGDGGDTNVGDGDCIATTGGCTLRAAIQEANDDNDHDIIQFALGGPAEIVTGFGLPAITEPLTIDGSTNPGANCDYLGGPATPAVPTVAINGSTLTIRAEADGSVIRNLAIHSATDGIILRGDWNTATFPFNNTDPVEDVVIECSWIGFRLDGSVGSGQTGTGVGRQDRGPNNTRIGGNAGDPGNVIGGFDEYGVNAGNATIFNNQIGVGPNGQPAGNGVAIRSGVLIGSNLIANSAGFGVESPLGAVTSNAIRENGASGVFSPFVILPPPNGSNQPPRPPVLIRSNTIENNGGLGIESTDSSQEPYGPSDGRVTVLSVSGSQLRVRADGGQELDVYFNSECDPSGFGEGQDYRETFLLPDGVDVHTLTMASPLPVGQFVTATVIVNEPDAVVPNLTSQFSNCRGERSQFVVNAQTNGGDANLGNGACADAGGFCTLRAAIEESNALGAGGVDEIVFDLAAGASIPVSGSALPPVTVPVVIDGSGNSGASCATAVGPPSGLIRLQGGAGITVGLVFTSTASGSELSGLQVTGFAGDGVRLLGDDFVAECNVFGSTNAGGNTGDGIEISNGDNNVVGGPFSFQGNLMVANQSAGVRISGASDFNRVSSNWIGTEGSTAVGNDVGVVIEGSAENNSVGSFLLPDGSAPGGNVIGGNTSHGVNVLGSGSPNNVTGNLVGVLDDGSAMGNGRHGIRTEADNVLIGRGRGAFNQLFNDPNVVGFNGESGMALFGDDVRVIENFIGVDAAGNDIGNVDYGVFVGGDNAGVEGNSIGFNGRDGVLLNGSFNDVVDNLIGVQPDGFSPAANDESGVDVRGDSNTVGGTDPADGNTILFNGGSGVSFGGTAELGVVQNNEIRGNGGAGIDVSGAATRNLFQENSVTGNDGLGIDLGADGEVDEIDDEDIDVGPNDRMNAPFLTQVDPEFTLVEFFYLGEPNTQHVIEFSANLACDDSGTGEGLRPIGSMTFVTNANGDGQGLFDAQGGFGAGEVLTALVSGVSGGEVTTTSEYSECLQVPGVNQTDSDGDGIFDVFELDEDTDGDGVLNRFDPDDDGDGRPTDVENVDIFSTGSGNTSNALNSDGLGAVDYLDPAALFRLLEPACRVLQTGAVKGGDSIDFAVTGGTPLSSFNSGPDDCVVPDDATAVLANVIVVDPVVEGNLRITAQGTVPSGGVVNFSANELNNSNALSVPLSASGELNVSVNLAGGSTVEAAGAIEVEILGFYQVAETPSLVLNTVTPCTVFDTRTTQGGSGPITADSLIGIDVVGSFPASQGGGNTNCQVPDGVEAVLANVVALNTSGPVEVSDALAGATVVSNQTHSSPMNNASAVALPVNQNGEIALSVDLSGSTNLRVVVLGHYFPAMVGSQAAAGLEFRPVVPCAAFDTRSNQGSSGGFAGQRTNGEVTRYDVVGSFPDEQGGGNTDCGVPDSAVAVELNLVAINASREGNLRVAAAGVTPTGGVLNFANLTPKMNNSNALVVEVSNSGQITVTTNGGNAAAGLDITDIRGVITGYYVFQADQS